MDTTIVPAPGTVVLGVEDRQALCLAFDLAECSDSECAAELRNLKGRRGYDQCRDMIGPLTVGAFIFGLTDMDRHIFGAVAQIGDVELAQLFECFQSDAIRVYRRCLQRVIKMLEETEKECVQH